MSDARLLVHVVDDDASIRVAIARLLGAAGYEVRCYASAGEFVIARAHEAGVILDMCMPGPNGLELQEAMQRDERCSPRAPRRFTAWSSTCTCPAARVSSCTRRCVPWGRARRQCSLLRWMSRTCAIARAR